MSNDADLLRAYVQRRDEAAFAELVRRHVDVVYAAALRRALGRADLAEEVAQRVFCDLARKAALLVHHPVLIAWLHRSTHYAAVDAVRRELRREKLIRAAAEMSDPTPEQAKPAPWEQVRPVLDSALDDLPERDRALVLLRFFSGLTFSEAGAQFGLREDAARRRTERALEKLRRALARRGVSSTTAALGIVLAQQPLVAAPAGLAATVAAAAGAAAPTGATAAVLGFFLMNKIALSAASFVVTGAITATVWTVTTPSAGAALKAAQDENDRLTRAASAEASGSEQVAVANDFATTANAIARRLQQRTQHRAETIATSSAGVAAGEVTARGHRNHGTATPEDAAMTFAWASDICDPDEFARLVAFDPDARAAAMEILATMPPELRAAYPTPESFYGMLLAASCLAAPPPGADLMKRFMVVVETAPGRAVTRRQGSEQNIHEYVETETGWRYLLPVAGVKGLPSNLNSETLTRLSRQ